MFTETVRQQAADYGMLLLRFLPLLMILTGSQVYGVTKYEIKVTTSDDIFAGTDASVHVNLIGVNGASTGSINLQKSAQDFDRGSHALKDLQEATEIEMAKKYKDVCESKEFLAHIDGDQLLSLLSRDDLSSPSETFIFKSVMQWIKHSKEERMAVAAKVIGAVRLGLVNIREVVAELNTQDMRMIPEINTLLLESLLYSVEPSSSSEFGTNKTRSRSMKSGRSTCAFVQLLTIIHFFIAKRCNISIPLGMENGHISNQSITASSHYHRYPPWHARLNSGTAVSWYALPSDPNPWIQVDLDMPTWLKGVATQGKRFSLFVKTYKLAYSSDGIHWSTYKDAIEEREMIFKGNTDPYKVVKVELDNPVYTRYVRLYPKTWRHGIAVKMELYGCRPE
ncbi:EGF-like repeat and discoidin I-like domain-containing protein 3 [Stylophora pistillata]|uniref:EGF-like repeat and discoidin I-like domain-containing protein 3 n=1 Tax=Stylophora pistillata TaxID=50429 RepID=A0A2B4R8A8_STYPI|nr:EGF-like repeat and discoidin I-like domain-containing protein 3 [Stylophora pistillata]